MKESAAAGARPRAAAATAVDQVVYGGRTLDTALADTAADLPVRDRAQAQAFAYGAVRWHLRHRALLARLLDRPLRARDRILEALLSVGLLQLRLAGQPAYAAVSATVGAARLLGRAPAAGLVNAALRCYQRERASLEEGLREDGEAWYAHPRWLIDALRRDWPDEWTNVLSENQQHPPFWLRVNRRRTSVAEYAQRLIDETGIGTDTLPGIPDALRLHQPLPVDRLPGFAEGLVSVQDAGAQLAAPLLLDGGHDRGRLEVLDACAAPGGKTTHLLELGGDGIDLTAIDVAADRLQRVHENLLRLGRPAGHTPRVLEADALAPHSWAEGRCYDRILVDAPCSATGVIRRHPDIRFLRRAGDIEAFSARQRQILEALWGLLRPRGRLLYVTCSVLKVENAGVAADFLAAHPEAREVPVTGRIPAALRATAPGPGVQLLPGSATDGFYYVLMERIPR